MLVAQLTSGWGVVGDFVTHDLHDIEAVSHKTDGQSERQNSELPDWHSGFRLRGIASLPSSIDDSPGASSVTNIIGTVSEGRSACGDDLYERVCVLNLVGILLRVRVSALHTASLWRALDTSLGSMNVVVDAIEKADDDHCGQSFEEEDAHILELVNLTLTDRVVVESAHCPPERTLLLPQAGMETFSTFGDELLVGLLGHQISVNAGALLLGYCMNVLIRIVITGLLNLVVGLGLDVASSLSGRLRVGFVLNNSIIGHLRLLRSLGDLTFPEERSLDDFVPPDPSVAVDHLHVQERNKEETAEHEQATSDTKRDGGNVPCRLVGESEVGGALVHNGQGTDGSGDEEEEW